MITTVSINGSDLYEEYDLILMTKKIGFPSAQTKYVEIPMRDGSVDYTEVLSDCIRYNNRTIEISLLYLGDDFTNVRAVFAKAYHGKKCKIIFSDDESFYYYGRVDIKNVKQTNHGGKFELKCECDPFKYDITASDAEWLWDPFDFESGIINELGAITVNGTQNATLICRRMREFPEFTASAVLELVYKGETYQIPKGTSKIYNLFFDEGENALTFKGNGTVSVHYVGGSL